MLEGHPIRSMHIVLLLNLLILLVPINRIEIHCASYNLHDMCIFKRFSVLNSGEQNIWIYILSQVMLRATKT